MAAGPLRTVLAGGRSSPARPDWPERQLNVGSLTREFLDQIVALSGEYGIPEK